LSSEACSSMPAPLHPKRHAHPQIGPLLKRQRLAGIAQFAPFMTWLNRSAKKSSLTVWARTSRSV
jgi:hypothetical protein